MGYRTEIYKEFLILVDKTQSVKKEEVTELFIKDLCVPVDADLGVLYHLFNGFQVYGRKLSIVKNLLHEQMSYHDGLLAIKKKEQTKVNDLYHRGKVDSHEYNKVCDDYNIVNEKMLAWRYYYNVARDKWELLGRTFDHIRSVMSNLKEQANKGM